MTHERLEEPGCGKRDGEDETILNSDIPQTVDCEFSDEMKIAFLKVDHREISLIFSRFDTWGMNVEDGGDIFY